MLGKRAIPRWKRWIQKVREKEEMVQARGMNTAVN